MKRYGWLLLLAMLCGTANAQNTVGLQAWWASGTDAPGPAAMHVHIDTDFPVGAGLNGRDPLTGEIQLAVTATVHHAPAGSKLTTTAIYSEPLHKIIREIRWNQTVGGATNQVFTWQGTLDTRLGGYDGRQEYRFLTKVNRPDGNSLRVTSGIQAYVANGKSVKHARSANWNEARGWYDGFNYQNCRFLDPWPISPVSGIWSPLIEITPGSGGRPTDRHWIVLDPANHFHEPGTMLRDAPGKFGKARFPIDTTQLAPGPHKLVLVGHEEDQSNAKVSRRGTLSSVLVIPFEVGP